MHTEQWGFSSFRILTVTTSTARIANMIAAQREATNAPPGLFLYSTPQLLAQHGALGPAWITSNRENIALFP